MSKTHEDNRNKTLSKVEANSPVQDMLTLWNKSRRVGTETEMSRKNLPCTDTDDSSEKSESGLDPTSGPTNPPQYSPKICPICREHYEVGDDICWSKVNFACAIAAPLSFPLHAQYHIMFHLNVWIGHFIHGLVEY